MMSVGSRLRTAAQATALVVPLLALYASGAYAQTPRPPGPQGPLPVASVPLLPPIERGWMGIGVDVIALERRRGPAGVIVRIVRTVDGGPAAEAGVVLGDIIRAIDGETLTLERWQTFTQNLRPGVDLRLSLDRQGRDREVRLTTASRPTLPPVPVRLTTLLDSVRTSFRIRLDSSRGMWASQDYVPLLMAGDSIEKAARGILDLARRNAVTYSFSGTIADLMAPSRQGGSRYSVVWNTNAALPLEYLVLQSPEAASVKADIIRLRGTLAQVTDDTRALEQEIMADLEQLAVRLAEIGSNERETRRQAAGFGGELSVRVPRVTAHVVGQSFVGGAQFNDLNPQLGSYFGTDRGVLVIQVLSGTPCDEAGLVPGDVVTHVGDTEIDSVEGFRSALNRVFARGRQAELTLVRRGERVTATLSR